MRITQENLFSVAVLAGGSSRRMGRDKALIEIDGDPMVLRAVEVARNAGADSVVVVGREPNRWPGVVSVVDEYPGEGPLGGVLTGLLHGDSEIMALMPCDLLEPSAGPLHQVVAAIAEQPEVDVAVPVIDSRRQYVQAGFRRTARPHLEARFIEGRRSLHDGIAGLDVVEVAFRESAWFADADEPADLPVASLEDDSGDTR